MKNDLLTSLQDHSLDTLEKAVVCGLLVSPNTLPDVVGWLQSGMFQSPDIALSTKRYITCTTGAKSPITLRLKAKCTGSTTTAPT